MAYASISFRGKPIIAVKPIEANDFDNLETLKTLAEKQDLPQIIVTQEAWSKYESMLFTPEEMKERIAS